VTQGRLGKSKVISKILEERRNISLDHGTKHLLSFSGEKSETPEKGPL